VSDQAAPLPDNLPAAITAVVTRLMEKEPDKRMRSAREAREVMQLILEGGLAASEISDTTPDIPSETGQIAIGLAETHHAIDSQPGAAPISVARKSAHPRSNVRWLAPVIAAALAVGGVAGYFVMRGRDAPPATPPPGTGTLPIVIDAVMPMSVDAALPVVDAAVAIDAAEVMLDAGAKKPKPSKQPKPLGGSATVPKAGSNTPPVPAPGSGSTVPDLEFLKSKPKH
jgi:hypothetical protein